MDNLGAKESGKSVEKLLPSCVFLFTHVPVNMDLDNALEIIANDLRDKWNSLEEDSLHCSVVENMFEGGNISFFIFDPVKSEKEEIFELVQCTQKVQSGFPYVLAR